jgi:hypothetical protein
MCNTCKCSKENSNSLERLKHREELEANVKYGHYSFGEGFITIAARFIKFTSEKIKVNYGLAFCAPMDTGQWSREIGREIAFKKLLQEERKSYGPDARIYIELESTIGLTLKNVIEKHFDMFQNKLSPKWIKQAYEDGENLYFFVRRPRRSYKKRFKISL